MVLGMLNGLPHTSLKHAFQTLMWLNGQLSWETLVSNALWMPSHCTITWSLCHPRPVWKTHGVGLIWSSPDSACSVLVPPSGGPPPNRQLADALTKDAADPVDLLRSCMRSGEYQLSPETHHSRASGSRTIQAQATTNVLSMYVTTE